MDVQVEDAEGRPLVGVHVLSSTGQLLGETRPPNGRVRVQLPVGWRAVYLSPAAEREDHLLAQAGWLENPSAGHWSQFRWALLQGVKSAQEDDYAPLYRVRLSRLTQVGRESLFALSRKSTGSAQQRTFEAPDAERPLAPLVLDSREWREEELNAIEIDLPLNGSHAEFDTNQKPVEKVTTQSFGRGDLLVSDAAALQQLMRDGKLKSAAPDSEEEPAPGKTNAHHPDFSPRVMKIDSESAASSLATDEIEGGRSPENLDASVSAWEVVRESSSAAKNQERRSLAAESDADVDSYGFSERESGWAAEFSETPESWQREGRLESDTVYFIAQDHMSRGLSGVRLSAISTMRRVVALLGTTDEMGKLQVRLPTNFRPQIYAAVHESYGGRLLPAIASSPQQPIRVSLSVGTEEAVAPSAVWGLTPVHDRLSLLPGGHLRLRNLQTGELEWTQTLTKHSAFFGVTSSASVPQKFELEMGQDSYTTALPQGVPLAGNLAWLVLPRQLPKPRVSILTRWEGANGLPDTALISRFERELRARFVNASAFVPLLEETLEPFGFSNTHLDKGWQGTPLDTELDYIFELRWQGPVLQGEWRNRAGRVIGRSQIPLKMRTPPEIVARDVYESLLQSFPDSFSWRPVSPLEVRRDVCQPAPFSSMKVIGGLQRGDVWEVAVVDGRPVSWNHVQGSLQANVQTIGNCEIQDIEGSRVQFRSALLLPSHPNHENLSFLLRRVGNRAQLPARLATGKLNSEKD